MAQAQYLSTDPHAGEPVTYLSTDPNAGRTSDTTNTVGALDRVLALLPSAGGLAGGLLGGAGGTAFGLGFGGIPGAAGGAALGGAGGEALQQLVNLLRGKGATSAGEAATDIGTEGGMQAVMELGGGAVTKGLTKGAGAVYRGYLKPSLSARLLPKADAIVQTALDEALPISRTGAHTGNRIIGELRQEVDRVLAKTKGTVDLHQVAERVRAFAKQRYFKPGVDTADYQQALGVADKLDQHAALKLPPGAKPSRVAVPLSAANEAKRGLYTSIKEAGFGTPQGAKKSTEKFAANQLKTGLERATGGATGKVATLNARESKLIDATKAIARAVEREANQNPLYGVKTLVAGAAGGLSFAKDQDPAGAAAYALATRALLHPAVASRAAIVASRAAKSLGISATQAARLAVAAVSESGQNGQNEP